MTAEVMDNNRAIHEFLSAEFPASQVKSFNQAKQGQPARWLSYIEDETVMDRLDTVVGPGNWSFTVDAVNTLVAKVTLALRWPESGTWATYSDFGYPTNGDRGEALKEAVSDGIRRCGRYAGIFRYGYQGHAPVAHAPAPAHAPARPAPAQKPTDEPWDDHGPSDIDEGGAEATCPTHNAPWRGDPYNGDYKSGRYHKAGDTSEGKAIWCRHRGDDAAKQAAKAR